MYTYNAKLLSVIDGNTIDAEVDLGFNIRIKQRIRLFGVEVNSVQSKDSSERELALDAKAHLVQLLPREFVVQTLYNKRGKVGRVLGYVYIDREGQQFSINDAMIEAGYAKDTGTK